MIPWGSGRGGLGFFFLGYFWRPNGVIYIVVRRYERNIMRLKRFSDDRCVGR